MIKTIKNTKAVTYLLLVFLFIIAATFISCNNKENSEANKPQEQKVHILTSTVAGGYWDDPKTWIQGIIPDKMCDVNINGRVIIKTKAECLNMIIDNGSQLELEKNSVLNIYSHVIQEGKIINNGKINVGDEIKETD